MDAHGVLQFLLFLALVLALTPILGRFMTWLFQAPVGRVEDGFYRLLGIDPTREQGWAAYAVSLLIFHLLAVFGLYALQRFQGMLPLNPAGQGAVPPDLAFNTAISFATNTNWQNYGGESTMSHLTQMAGLTVHNFLSAAAGIAVAVALMRGFARHSTRTVGNFYVDITRVTLGLLLPLCLVGALVLVGQGVPQNFDAPVTVTTLEGVSQVIAQGPVASQMMIKHLGTNGGGFFNANAAHPYENPNALVNLIHMLAIFAIGAALTNTFGRMAGDRRQGWALLGAMAALFLAGLGAAWWAEAQGNPVLGGIANMEGKEVRLGVAASMLFAVVTTVTSCGAVNAMHDSLLPLAGMIPMVNMLLGEVVVGGVGSGLYGMVVFALLTVFIAGLMVGRTPEYLGKKIEAREIKLAVIAILATPVAVLGIGGLAITLPMGQAGIAAAGPHGLSEVLYAFASAGNNNGSAFGGLSGNTIFYNATMAAAMMIGRFVVMIPVLAIAGALAAKMAVPASAGTFPTHGWLFVVLLVGIVLVVGGLTYFPVLVLGPVVEHLALSAGILF
ncbi:potassium-transporting ATPase subunit KdpA [Paramagnetospirillum magneticum]|uniref:Potassium-transporting ATPase potassium-binding subunit n=1 Tax=Paramagnetospirillum magneticum (strain ATCC 700264 / AMB-1) TaxID=342108 RepID=KDPA_PARM1|nr:potassium-transporting ATPase subunit KdpA [Paramagnetospirillum magneticum]Q2W612.1 RecName: Full=Potassium-transporting ATPase potassium-binding subunit; AltName: Full=ATP phosphohydrolase [potassium-transporting] A chain; AltName: Full=Potassium-binding and translocating subunit A; AltName: Full=Potassium-translocating ATPase A chain [Paramagnetospirillum magneticum AMB-1]BAE50713.1 K+-transporting ATPase [Paramagnetospirillum magneticum AMB-1]